MFSVLRSRMARSVNIENKEEMELWNAASKGNVPTLTSLLQKGVSPNICVVCWLNRRKKLRKKKRE